MPKYCAVLPPSEAIRPDRLGTLLARNAEFLYAQAELLKLLTDVNPPGLEEMPEAVRDKLAKEAALQAKIKAERVAPAPSPFHLTFGPGHPAPERVIETWMEDEEQAAQMVRGINPMKLRRVTDAAAELPPLFHGLVDPAGRGVADLAAANALFYADYAELMVGEPDEATGAYTHVAESPLLGSTVGGAKYWYAPRLVVYKTPAGKLTFLAFTLTRRGDAAGDDELYTPAGTPPVRYSLAKIHLTCADNQVHQFVSHLGMTHLLAEPFIVAAHNVLPAGHIVAALLAPHFTDTIGINFLARQTLVSTVAPLTDATFSVGTAHALSIFAAAYDGWDFLGDNFVGALAKRGFTADAAADGLTDFYYRDDGFRVWNALTRYVSAVLHGHYGEGGADGADGAVADDPVLAAWCAEMRDPAAAGMASFPAAFATVSALTEALVSIIFLCSAQHAAVNFPQADYVQQLHAVCMHPGEVDSLQAMGQLPHPPAVQTFWGLSADGRRFLLGSTKYLIVALFDRVRLTDYDRWTCAAVEHETESAPSRCQARSESSGPLCRSHGRAQRWVRPPRRVAIPAPSSCCTKRSWTGGSLCGRVLHRVEQPPCTRSLPLFLRAPAAPRPYRWRWLPACLRAAGRRLAPCCLVRLPPHFTPPPQPPSAADAIPPRTMSLMAAFVGATPASAFRGSAVGRSLSSRRHVTAAPVARRPPPPRMMATEEFGEWKKKADKKGSKTTTAEKTNAEVKVDDAVQSISEDTTESNVTAFQPPTMDTTVFSDWVDQFDAKLAAVKQKVADVDTEEIKGESSAAAKSLVDNFIAGDWLNRGELWGALQVAFVYLMLKDPGNLDGVVAFFVGPVVLLAGAALSLKGAWDLGRKQISLWPAPVPEGTLRTDGIYAYIRHPLYSGVLLTSLGFAAATSSAERFALTFALMYALKNKVEVEEKFLEEAYGDEFYDYVEATPFKFIPKFW